MPLGPLAQQRHQPYGISPPVSIPAAAPHRQETLTCSQAHDAKSGQHHLDLGPPHAFIEHELVRHELDEPGVQQDPRRDAVEDPVDDQARPAAEPCPGPEPCGDGHWRRQAIPQRQDVRSPAPMSRPRRDGQS